MISFFSLVGFQQGPNGGFGMSQPWFWVLLLIPVLVVIVLLYRLFLPDLKRVKMTEKLEELVEKTVKENIEKNIDVKNKSVESKDVTTQETSIKIALRLLESDEKRVVKSLVDAGGSILQKEISWKTGFSRVKTHRILVRLLRRGVVTSEKYYNTNKITLSKWLFNHENRENI